MQGERTQGDRGALGRLARAGVALAAAAAALAPRPAAAAPGDTAGANGLVFARRHNCVKAVPLLEQAELARHRPSWAVPLADCYVATGELLRASELYHAVTQDAPQRFWVRADYNAKKAAQRKAQDVDKRIPTIRFTTDVAYTDLEVEVGGKPLADPTAEKPVAPDVSVTVVARARGRVDFSDDVVLHEGERRVVALHLAPALAGPPPKKKTGKRPVMGKGGEDAAPTMWLGVRYYGAVIPKFVMNFVADGGRNLVVPGGAFTFTTLTSDVELTVALGYLSYRMGATPFKGHGEPDTEWENVSSTLQALTATVDLMWSFPLGDSGVSFRIGGAAGVGWMFLGDMYRVQTYPQNFKPGVVTPGDPSTYLPCQGPNNPRGTYLYCNTLDKDAKHYPGYTEPDWFHGGIRPSLFPWLVVPQMGFSFRPSYTVVIDLDTGVSLSGILTSLGVRFGL
jgi:hypothetical protein